MAYSFSLYGSPPTSTNTARVWIDAPFLQQANQALPTTLQNEQVKTNANGGQWAPLGQPHGRDMTPHGSLCTSIATTKWHSKSLAQGSLGIVRGHWRKLIV